MLTTTTKPERLEARIADLQAKRSDLRDMLYAIAGDQANRDRENQLTVVERQLTRALVELAGCEG